jgi:hypothetical protein
MKSRVNMTVTTAHLVRRILEYAHWVAMVAKKIKGYSEKRIHICFYIFSVVYAVELI